MSAITTHVLDTSVGKPARGVAVTLSRRTDEGWVALATGETDADGRVHDLLPGRESLSVGVYRLSFAIGTYFSARQIETFYPHADVTFSVRQTGQHYHVPLLVSPYGYATYRGS